MIEEVKSHKQILKSTGIVGGSQIVNILITIIRTKIVAILLGPIGVGYIGIFQSILDLVRQASGFGINFSGVKDVAESNATNDIIKISTTITILRRWAFYTGILGTFLTIVFCVPLSEYSFGDNTHAKSISIIAISVLIISVNSGQIALLQGLRKISLMAKATIYGSILGTIIIVPLYYFKGIEGIVPGIVFISLGGLLLSWWFTRDIKLEKIQLSISDTFSGGIKMARLGFFITINGIIATLVLYVVRAFLIKKMNIDAVGSFHACWMITTLYLGTVLNAMITDFFPRLSEVNKDNVVSNRLINEQVEIALLVASPLIIGIIVFADLIITILYSSAFSLAIPVLQWLIAGSYLTIITFPLGVLFLARSKGGYGFITESIWNVVFLTSLYFGWDYYGFMTIGYSYVLAGVIRGFLGYYFVYKLSNFKYSKFNINFGIFFGAMVILTLLNVTFFSSYVEYMISLVLLTSAMIYSYVCLSRVIDIKGFIQTKLFKNK
jgi:O-antigen/teichoic acid export membrane protein